MLPPVTLSPLSDADIRQRVARSLENRNGLLRELLFEHATWDGLGSFLASLGTEPPTCSIFCVEDDARLPPPYAALAPLAANGLRLSFAQGSAPLWSCILLVAREQSDAPFVALSFESHELQRTAQLLDRFVDFAEKARQQLRASRALLGFEGLTLDADDAAFLILDGDSALGRPAPPRYEHRTWWDRWGLWFLFTPVVVATVLGLVLATLLLIAFRQPWDLGG